jgi:hypothetical protein
MAEAAQIDLRLNRLRMTALGSFAPKSGHCGGLSAKLCIAAVCISNGETKLSR